MTNRLRQRPVLRAALALALAILLVTTTGAASLPVHGEALAAGRNVADKINLKTLVVSIDNTPVYDSTQALAPTVRLKPDSTMSFNLSWDVKGEGDDFRDGDYFSIPVVRMEELRLTEPFTQKLELDAGGGKVAVAEGRFTYAGGLLAFEVVFNSNAQDYRIEGGPAGGYAEFTLSSGLTSIPMTFGDSGTVTVDVESGPSGTDPALPGFPGALPGMRKAVFSPDVSGSTVNLTTRYETIPASGERKFGLDWRMTFFDLVAHFQGGGGITDNVVIEDIVGGGQSYSNFADFSGGDRDKGFAAKNDEDYEAPFFIELPIVAVGSNRVYNLYGGTSLTADSRGGYVGTIIRADQLQSLSGADVAAQVRQRPLSWGIERMADGREKLIINLGRLGPGVKKGEGLTADLVREKDYPYAVLDGVIVQELLAAQRMVQVGGADAEQWKRVRKESLDSILYYWPAYRDKLCAIAGIPAGSDAAALENALFAIPYDQLSQSKITTLGYDERRTGGIAGTMRIDSFVLRYRTVISSVADTDLSNSVKISTGVLSKEDTAGYRHQFYAGIFGSVNVGEVAFIKTDSANGHRAGETTEADIQGISGLAGAEFEVYEASGGAPLRFVKDGSVYTLRSGGDVMTLRSDEGGGFKITGLSPSKSYALREKTPPTGYETPTDPNTLFRVSASASRYYVINNDKTAKQIPGTPGRPGTPDGPDNPNRPDGPDGPDAPVRDRNKLALYKVDSMTGVKLKGATFRLRYPDGTEAEATTGSNGLAQFDLPGAGYAGTYTVVEFIAPGGYILNSQEVEFTVSEDRKMSLSDGYVHVQLVEEDTAVLIENTREDRTRKDTPKPGTPTTDIPEGNIPLTNIPKTGVDRQGLKAAVILALVSAAAAAALRKRK